MKKRGFTLTEVLGVIVILGLIALIIFPNVSKSIKNSRQKLYNQQVSLIEENARKWGVDHTSLLPDSGTYYLTLNDLMLGGYISQKELKDPRDDSAMNGCVLIRYDETYNQYKYEYTEASCEDRPNDDTVPTLTVTDYNGTVGDNVALSSQYTATYGVAGGKTTCKYGETPIINVNYFSDAGTYAVKCVATGMNGKTSEEQTMNIVLASAGTTGSDIVKDNPDVRTDDPGENPRFVGGNPNNYVDFGNDMYRIIGVFNGQMKLIYWGPKTAVGQFYQNTNLQFDPNSSQGGHGTYGYNDWSQAKLQTTLNTTYWNTINSVYQGMVDQSHVWDIGGQTSNGTRSQFYNTERNSATWTGKVGLMYPSDYGYATNGTSCDSDMNTWYSGGEGNSNCYGISNNWLAHMSYYQWTMTPRTGTENYVFYVTSSGQVNFANAHTANVKVRPVLYLKSNVKITNAEETNAGTVDNPYQLSL